MLEKLVIKDFQKHVRLEIDFDRVTVFCGPSDVGKSSILRALKWTVLNQPQGDEFVRHGKDSCLVKLKVDGRWVARHRSKTDNSYRLDGKVLKSFGKGGVPDPVADLLNVGDVTFQGQHDLAYWFCESPPEVSRRLNAIVNLGLIDSSLKNASDAVRRAESDLKHCRERLKEAKTKRKELEHVKGLENGLKQIQALQDRLESTRLSEEAIATLQEEAIALDQARRAIVPDTGPVETLIARKEGLSREYQELSQLLQAIGQLNYERDFATLQLEDAERELKSFKVCPTCGQAIGRKHRVH